MDPPPPPPPPHGTAPKSSGLPPGNYDIFIIPPHSSGAGFLYLPSLQPHRNSFLAGFGCALVVVLVLQIVTPVLREWLATIMATGGSGVLLLVLGVGIAGWAWGKSQTETAGSSSGGQSFGSGSPGGGSQQTPGGAGGQPGEGSTGAGVPPGGAHSGSTGGAGTRPKPTWQRSNPGPTGPGGSGAGTSRGEWTGNTGTSSTSGGTARGGVPGASGASTAGGPGATRGSWEKAREETRRKEEERKKKEEQRKRKDEERKKQEEEKKRQEDEGRRKEEEERKAREAAEKERWEKARTRETEAREREARERRENEELERRDREAKQKEKEEKEKAKQEEARREEEENTKREKSTTYAATVGEKTYPYVLNPPLPATPAFRAPDTPPPSTNTRKAKGSTPSSPVKQPATPTKRPISPTKRQQTTAKTYVGDDDGYSFRPYDKPKQHLRKDSSHSSIYSESSYAPSQSTSRTTPPPSRRGPYTTKDPDKIVIKAVYAFNNAFIKLPTAQLVSGVGSVTDGLILKITTEGLFIDDDVRNIAQREWDVKAWTLKLVEVWCPQFWASGAISGSSTSTAGSGSGHHRNPVRRLFGDGKTPPPTSEETDLLLESFLRLCNGKCSALAKQDPNATSQSGDFNGLHVLRATIRDQEGKKYIFVLGEEEGWKVAVGLQRLRRGTQVRALGVGGLGKEETRTVLGNLGWAS